ncbi:hypothetical protein E0D86_01185 [Pseudomonas sp. IC_126]|uniref:BRO-N domain-containing protein n=1 Tax=Pseudomonas sp. IC_126 TaxID=2547400 RepID=UPI00103E66DF|nr:Bro-N domain-containing protein [Pseudomonas sp. IC_126]TCD23858.1 hypothetical protein E0D86_01185 [Pseudomonas sp. IC_126]
MNETNLILAYPDSGREIRTLYRNNEVMFCLSDVVQILAEQNTELAKDGKKVGLGGLTKGLLDALDSDEKYSLPDIEVSNPQDSQFVTQPGLFRIILRDNSPACKKFQRWVFHEVLPSIQKFGTYPPPAVTQGSEVKKAVMLLLEEIEERERLERETKARFEHTERRLNELSEKISTTQAISHYGLDHLTVSDYCTKNCIDLKHEHLIRGWCIKICAEEGHSSYKISKDGQTEVVFPESVLLQSASNI